jgi:hypothetical protein
MVKKKNKPVLKVLLEIMIQWSLIMKMRHSNEHEKSESKSYEDERKIKR